MTPHCLVTGASGFIGGHLTTRLARDGWRVRCLVRPDSDTSRLVGVQTVVGDLTDRASLARAVDGCRVVFHCGAMVTDWATIDELTRVNVQGTDNVVTAARAAGVERLVHFSTTDVYGYRGSETVTEADPGRGFSNWYAETKRRAEDRIRRAGLPAVILRPATVYGPGSREVVGEIAQALRHRSMLLIDGGRAVAGLVYVENLVDAAIRAAGVESAAGEAFNVTDGWEVTWRQFTDDLARGLGHPRARWSLPFGVADALGLGLEQGYRVVRRATGVSTRPLLSRQAVHVLGNNQRFSNEKIRTRLGWEPRIGYEDGLEATLAWLRSVS
jgi:polyketide synthase